MKHLSFRSFSAFVKEAFATLVAAARGITRLHWAQLLMICIGISLLIAILPLALGLFVLLMVGRFVLSLFAAKPEPEADLGSATFRAPAAGLPAPRDGGQ